MFDTHPSPRNERSPKRTDVVAGARDRAAAVQSHRFLNCPRCGLTIKPRARWLEMEHCPRCLARARMPVKLFSSSLPAADLYAAPPTLGAALRRRRTATASP